MQYSAVLREVDLLAREHIITQLLEVCLLGQLDEQWERLIVQEVLAEVPDDLSAVGFVLEDMRVLLESLWIVLEEVPQNDVLGELLVVLSELRPGLKTLSADLMHSSSSPYLELRSLRESRHGDAVF